MTTDIVIPNNNEEEFLKMAKELGYDSLIFVYKGNPKEKKSAFLAKDSNEVSKNLKKYDYILAKADPWAFNDKRVDFVFGFEKSKKKDFMHHRASNMNQVVAKQLKQNKTAVAFDFASVLLSKERDVIVGRMTQNVRICRKYKVKMKIVTCAKNPYEMRAPKDLIAFGITLGMHQKEAKEALN